VRLVSVIIACLNDLEHLPRAVDSVLSQNFTDLELVIMDGGSNDGTPDYLRTLTDPRVQWRSERDGGLTEAWNKAVELARGDWYLFLGADDYIWDNAVLQKAAPHLQASNALLAFGEVRVVAQKDDTVVHVLRYDTAMLLAHLQGPNGLGLPHQGFFHSRHAFASRAFDKSFRLAADYEFISRFSRPSDFAFLPIGPVAAFRLGGLTTDPWVSLEAYREFARIHRLRGKSLLPVQWLLAKAKAKLLLRRILGESLAKNLVNLSRIARGFPPYSG
jgi:glycosyltransferase involved in cell wall biosynthesis